MRYLAKRIFPAAALALTLVFFGCQAADRSGTSTTPQRTQTPQTQISADKIIPIQLEGLFVRPDTTLRITEGTQVVVHAATDGLGRDFTNGGQGEGIPVRVRHDAPPDQVTAGGEVRVGGSSAPGIVHIRALADDVKEPEATFSLWLEPVPGHQLSGGFVLEVDSTPLRFRVVDAHPADCGNVRIAARLDGARRAAGSFAAGLFGDDIEDYQVARLTIQTADPHLGVSLTAPYRERYAHLEEEERPNHSAFPATFALSATLWGVGDTLRQTFSLAYFAPLELTAESPGCEPIRVQCETSSCNVR